MKDKQNSSPSPLPNTGKAKQRKDANKQPDKRRGYAEASRKRADAERQAMTKAEVETNQAQGPVPSEEPYFLDTDGYLCRVKRHRDSEITIRLSNFEARITEENVIDDGAERSIFYTIDGSILGKHALPSIEVPAPQFSNMTWVHKWGSRVILEPGRTVADSVRHSIQLASSDAPVKHHYGFTGWKEIDGSWAYLHAAGSVGAEGVSVRLAPEYARFRLPDAPQNETEAIQASLNFLDIGKRQITIPLLSYVFLSPLTTILPKMPGFSLYLYGISGSFKTTLAALCLCHFGDFSQVDSLPNFNDTPGSIEKRAFKLKDTLFLLDDYTPSHKKQEQQRKEDVVQSAIRSFGNRTGRARLRADASEMPRTYPRGLLLVTGEEAPSLQSTIARTLILELSRKDIDQERLTILQEDAHRLPHAMTSYLLWIRDNMNAITGKFPDRFLTLRNMATNEGQHGRLAEQTAFLVFALETWVNWLVDKKIFSTATAKEMLSEGWEIFQNLTITQSKRIEGDDPIASFFEILGTLIYQHKVRLDPCHKEGEIMGAGDRVGFYDNQRLYLVIGAAWNAVLVFLSKEGGHYPFSKSTFLYMLRQRGAIIPAHNGESTKPKTIGGESFRIVEVSDRLLINSVTSVIHEEY
ncbi:hypothetical protein SAMN04489760_14714 [Syntrophus gentianae]|uniref:DUF927 domain-containing protein n=1 Tax=Syntrophus gentianae TaxID=43775 RepID=A0A1H8B6H4_9BACT|nr:hypothetical protein [Syntrophus gentianae]SEM78555.1 hypothetical protein SAMN04489760_14714 [Syntrophus gentianae]